MKDDRAEKIPRYACKTAVIFNDRSLDSIEEEVGKEDYLILSESLMIASDILKEGT